MNIRIPILSLVLMMIKKNGKKEGEIRQLITRKLQEQEWTIGKLLIKNSNICNI